MNSNLDICLSPGQNLQEAWEIINRGKGWHTLFVRDTDGRVLGSVTDGDLRRAVLQGMNLKQDIIHASRKDFYSLQLTPETYISFETLIQRGIRRIPIVNHQNQYQSYLDIGNTKAILPFEVFILAGGKGERLMPLTQKTPKSLLPVAGKPVLEWVLELVNPYCPARITLALHHQAEQIQDFCEHSISLSSPLHFIHESQPLGTAGALAQLTPMRPYILVMNADLITDIDLEKMYLSSITSQADLVMATAMHHLEIPYAVVKTDAEGRVQEINEKPRYPFAINTGIYLLRSEMIAYLQTGQKQDMPDFLNTLLSSKHKLQSFPWQGLWRDIGHLHDYEFINKEGFLNRM